MTSIRVLIKALTHLQVISTDTISASYARRRQVRNTLFRLGLAVGGALVLLCGLLLNLAGIAPSLAAGGLSVEILAGYNLVVDSNVTSPSTAGPSAFTPGARICNTTASPINDVVVKIGDSASNTAGIYPERGPGSGSFNTDHPALVDGGGTYAFTHEGGSQGIADATRLVGTLGPGECVMQYWTLSYPRCENVAGVADEPQCQNNAVWGSSVKPEDDLYLDFDVWATGSGGADGTSSRTMYLRNEISAMANKIQPNGNLGSTWFNTELDQVKPGSVITTNGILYRIGNVRFGFDNDGDYQPDYNFWMQPIGDASQFDTGCFRLIRTSGVITIAGGTDTSFTFEDQLYFSYPQVPSDNTNVIGEVFYTFLALGDNCAATPTPYQEAASGYDNEKFNADYGAGGNAPFNSTPVEVTVDKDSLPSITGPGTFITYEIPFQNTSTTDSAGLTFSSGDVVINTPLVISDTIPPETEYQAGSATSSFSTSGLTATVYYSTDNGDSWTTTEPTPASSVTNIQWWLSEPLPPTEDGTATFQVFIPLDYSLPVLENCANLQYGNGPSVAESCVITIITGPNSIGDFVWLDENANGLPDGGEAGIDAITVTLYYDADGNGQLDTSTDLLMTSTVTSGGGNYLFDNLADGNYLVVVSTDDPDLPFGYKITTNKVIAVDLDSSNATTTAVDYLDADFGFGPALSVQKTLISSKALEGKEIEYRIDVTNLRPGNGSGQTASCSVVFWAGTSSINAGGNPDWSQTGNGGGEPDGSHALGNFSGNGSALLGDNFTASGLPGNIVSVEAIYSLFVNTAGGTLNDDVVQGIVYSGTIGTVLTNTTFANASLNAFAGAPNQDIYSWDITSARSNWKFADFSNVLTEMYINKNGGSDGAIINLDALGFRVTTDSTCGNPSDTLNPVPLSDTFDADLLEFVSADPPQTTVTTGLSGDYANTGLIEWTNVGPLYAGQTKEIIVTFIGKETSLIAPTTLTNTATVTNAYFVSGEPANDGQDDATTVLTPTGTITGIVWSDSGVLDGWQGSIGYQGDDSFIPYVTVRLYECVGVDSTPDLGRDCSTSQNNNAVWILVATTTTDANGAYEFDGLDGRFYYVQVVASSIPGGGTLSADPDNANSIYRCTDSSPDCVTTDGIWNGPNAELGTIRQIGFSAGQLEVIPNINFGYNTNGLIFGTVWEDVDGDGVQEEGEGALVGSVVELQNGSCTPGSNCPTVTIGATGTYSFTGLTAGAYTIVVTTPSGTTWTQTVDPDDLDSNYSLSLASGQVSGSHDFAYTATGSYTLGDTVYIDWDGDGTQDAAEPGIENVTLSLYEDEDGDGVIDSGVDALISTTVTNASGFYQFTSLASGNYIVVVDIDDPDFPLPAGQYVQTEDYDSTLDNRAVVNLTSSIDAADFGYHPTGFGSIGDYVWHDSNSNGLQGANESGLPNIQVTLYADDGDGIFNIATDSVVITTTTDAGGKYLFTNLISATYWVDVDTADSDLPTDGFGEPYILTTNNDPLKVVLNSGDTYLNADFGFDGPAVVGNFVWQDNDGDGEQDAGEPGIAGITVRLFQETSPGVFTLIATDTTDSAGVYLFSGLISDTYRVVVDETTLPPGYSQQTGDPDVGSISGTSFACDDTNGSAVDDCDAESTFQLKTGQIDLTRDFGYLPPRFTGNYIWFDADGDGVQDFTEPGLAGITVTVTLPDLSTFTTFTDIEGYYSFGSDILGTTNGNFTITIDPGSTYTYTYDYDGSTATPDGTTVLNIAATNFYTDVIDFGLRLNGPHTITGTVFYDTGNTTDGLTDTYTINDTPFANVTVYLYKEGGGAPVGITTTDTSGHYTFTNLLDGEVYVVSIDTSSPVIDGYNLTASPTSGSYFHILPALTGDVGDIDFGFWEPAPILSLTKTVSPAGTVSVGDILTYTLTVSNTGALTATGVIITDTLPVSTTFVTATTPYSGPTNGVITWTLGSVAANTDGVVTLTVQLDTAITATLITNTAWLTSNESITDTDTVTSPIGTLDNISGQVRNDVDGDGVLADPESGIPGVTIVLYSDPDGDGDPSDGTPLLTTTTTITGFYQFTRVMPGNYVIVESDPSGYTSTTDTDAPNDNRISITLVGGTDSTGNDFLDTQSATIGNDVWLDENGDGIQDAGESGIANVIVELRDSGNTLVATTTTDSNGGYLFTNLIPGDYTVTVDITSLPADLAANSTFDEDGGLDNQSTVTVTAGEEHLTADFGYNWVSPTDTDNPGPGAPGVIGDRVWIDDDGDGNQDPGEPGLGGITVTLYTDPDGDGIYNTPVATTTTNLTGGYIFTGLTSSSYVVQITAPAGYTQTGDPDTTLDNRTTFPVIIGPGDVYLNADFGYQPPAAQDNTIGDQVWLDADGDGAIDVGEPGIPGVTVALIDDTNNNGVWDVGEPIIATDITDSNGVYLFNGIPDGNYLVKVTDIDHVLGGLSQSYDDEGAPDNLSRVSVSGGVSELNEDFGYTPGGQTPGEGFIGDTMFLDTDGNGSQDTGEPGLEGVIVTLIDAGGSVYTTTTNENGTYWFGNLDPTAIYTVTVITTTLPNGGVGLANSADPDGGSDSTSVVDLSASGGIDLDQDFGYQATTPNTISGTIWEDVNADGTLVVTETNRFSDVTVGLFDSNGHLLGTTTTDSNGDFSFTGLPDGTYTVDVLDSGNVLNGYWHSDGPNDGSDNNSQDDPYSVTVGGGTTDSTADFGYYIESGGLGNFIWNDLDGNGIQDTGEPGLSGITVTLTIAYPNGASVTLKTTTDASGYYTFTNLVLDEDYLSSGGSGPVYTLTVVTPTGYLTSPIAQGSDADLDSHDPAGINATVTQGVINTTYDFGFYLQNAADLFIEKYDLPKVVAPGDTLTYTIRFENKGPSAVNAITITETLPDEANSFSYSVNDASLIISPSLTLTGAAAISDAMQVGSTVTWNGSYPTSPIISGTVGYITFTVKVDQSYLPGDDHLIENTLVITGNQPDPNPGDNTFTETTPIADIVVEKATNGDDADTITGPSINFGDPVTWTYQVTNTGSITLTGVQITDRDDAGNLVVITPTVAITLAPGETMTFTYVATASVTGQYTNTATITGTAIAGGNDAFGNVVTRTSTVTDTDLSHYLAALADVTIVKSDNPDPVTLGKVLTYTLVYTNNGPAGASDVTITDTLPSEVTFGGMVSGSSPTQSGQSLTWNIGPLGNGLDGSLIFTVTVDSAGTGTITNSVVITTSTPDSDPSNNDDDEPTTVESPGITISKSPDLQTVEAGSTVTFTITVTNTGDVTLTQVVVSDALVSDCDTGPGSLLPKTTQIYTCTTTAGVTAGFTNTAIVSGTSPGGTVVTSTDTAVVEVITPGLEVEKTVNIASAAPSQIVTYTITITNTGDITLNPVRITDTMDAGLTYISGSASIAPSSVNGQQLVWNDATAGAGLVADDTLQLTLLAEVTTITGTYNNVVVAVGRYPTGSTTPDSDSVPVVVEDPAVEVAKGVAAPGAVNGTITFTIRITNTGPSILDQVPLFDRFVGPIEYIGGTPLADAVDNTNGVLSWDDLTQAGPHGFGQNLAPDAMFELTTVFRITENNNTFSMVNTAEVTGAVDIFNNTANDADETVTLDNEPTAIELLYFKGRRQGEDIVLNWATAVEIDNYGFRLFRSPTASRADAVEIAFVPGQGLGTGSGATYTYTDKQVAPNQTYTYWLVDVDLNGTETDHSPVTVTPTGIDSGDNTRLYLPLILHDK